MISNTNQLEIRHFRYFNVLAEQLHFGKAAEKLEISQSALSQQIKQIEQILDSTLIKRNQKQIRLSNAGKLFYADSKTILVKIDALISNQQFLKKGFLGTIRIGFVGSAMEEFLPPILKKLVTELPKISLHLNELSNEQQLNDLQSEIIDVGFIRSNQVSPAMNLKPVYPETFSLVLPIDHPLDKYTFNNFQLLKNENFILYPNKYSPLYYQQIIDLCSDHGFVPNIIHNSVHTLTIMKLVSNGMGVSIVPTSCAKMIVPNIKFIELAKIRQRTELYVVWNKYNQNPVLNYLLKLI